MILGGTTTRKLNGSTVTEYHCSACGRDYELFS